MQGSREALVVVLELIGALVVAGLLWLGLAKYLEMQERRRSGAGTEEPRD